MSDERVELEIRAIGGQAAASDLRAVNQALDAMPNKARAATGGAAAANNELRRTAKDTRDGFQALSSIMGLVSPNTANFLMIVRQTRVALDGTAGVLAKVTTAARSLFSVLASPVFLGIAVAVGAVVSIFRELADAEAKATREAEKYKSTIEEINRALDDRERKLADSAAAGEVELATDPRTRALIERDQREGTPIGAVGVIKALQENIRQVMEGAGLTRPQATEEVFQQVMAGGLSSASPAIAAIRASADFKAGIAGALQNKPPGITADAFEIELAKIMLRERGPTALRAGQEVTKTLAGEAIRAEGARSSSEEKMADVLRNDASALTREQAIREAQQAIFELDQFRKIWMGNKGGGSAFGDEALIQTNLLFSGQRGEYARLRENAERAQRFLSESGQVNIYNNSTVLNRAPIHGPNTSQPVLP